MTKQEFEKQYNVHLIPKAESRLMRAFGVFMLVVWAVTFMWLWRRDRKNLRDAFIDDYWTTYRLPFGVTKITYPKMVPDPMDDQQRDIREHELLHHIHQLEPWWGPLTAGLLVIVVPLPIIFSGRWYLERRPYLHNIVYHRYDIQSVVDSLWSGYMIPWPKGMMLSWFKKKEQEMIRDKVPNPFND